MRTLLALPHLDLYLHDGPKPVLELHWRSYATSTDFRAALTQALRLSLAHQVRSWVADDRLLGAVRPRDVEWAEQELLVPLDKTGLERFAQLESPDALNRRTIDLAYTRTMPTLHFAVQRFEDLDQARAWASGRA
ncbi:MAG: hypothetical protein EOO63_13045 [Hymenobacter sp.]|nr:MAG: hypothetical protein EOO63_13045 [Hymenobacter sp.]